MTNYFDEKSTQVVPDSLVAFGVDIVSRYGKANEIVEMINFARVIAQNEVSHYVKSVFYNSNDCLCTIELAESVKDGDIISVAIKKAALETIGQFDWFGYVQHGAPLENS